MTNNKPKILIVLPVYNEETVLKENVLKIYIFLKEKVQYNWKIIIADNQSNDSTGEIGKQLAKTHAEIKYLYIPKKGKGVAIKAAWLSEKADIYSFMDIDLSTDLEAFPRLIAALTQENYDLAIGSRFLPTSYVKRPFLRKLISYGYHLILRFWLGSKIKDAPCGFKAVNSKIINNLLPQIKNNEWFFDSELVLMAEKQKYKIKEIPVKWTEPSMLRRKSKINIFKTSLSYLKEILKFNEARVFLKFLAVGFLGFVINAFGLFILVEIFSLHPSFANIIAAEIAIFSNFLWNNFWTFDQKKITNPFKLFYKFSLFNLTSIFGVLFIQTGIIHLGVMLLGKSLYMLYFLLGTTLLLIWNFTFYNKIIWKDKINKIKNF